MRRYVLLTPLIGLLFSIFACASGTPSHDPTRFESTITGFEKLDRQTPPPTNPTIFIGSSTFTKWKNLAAEFKDFGAINRAFGGSTLADIAYYADRMIIAYKPRTVVLYAGTNDITVGTSPEEAANDFVELVEHVHAALPDTQIYFVAVIPAPVRVKLTPGMDDLNARVQKYIGQHAYLHYIDARYALSDPAHQPDPKFYVFDRLHPNQKGYSRLVPLIRAALNSPVAATQAN